MFEYDLTVECHYPRVPRSVPLRASFQEDACRLVPPCALSFHLVSLASLYASSYCEEP